MQPVARVALRSFFTVLLLMASTAAFAGVTATKSVSGTFVQGTNVTYTIVMTNTMSHPQNDNAGPELTDVLPSQLMFVSAAADSGTAQYFTTLGAVRWNGAIASGQSVTITIEATINPTASGTISNQGTISFDADGNGSNEASGVTDDPSTGAANDASSFNVIQSGEVTVTKSVSGTFVQGTDVTYTIVMTNDMTVAQPDNFGHEFTDALPSGLTFVSAEASSGTVMPVISNTYVVWNGSIPADGSVTLTIVCTIDATASGTISNQAHAIFDRDGDNQNESESWSEVASFNVVQSGRVSATKTVSGTFIQGTNVTYTIVLTNSMTVAQPDNYANESVDALPSGLTLLSASATSGTILLVPSANVVTWNGSIPAGGSVTYEIVATISPTAVGTISNQAYVYWDSNEDGHNDGFGLSDDPSAGGTEDPTSFTVIQTGQVTATKSVSGTFVQGTDVTYTITLTNNKNVTQPDNYGNESVDVLPSGLTLVSADATSGTILLVPSNNSVTWNGSIPPGGTVTYTIVATIDATASGTISNQAYVYDDSDADGDNDRFGLSDEAIFNVIQANEVLSTMSVSGTFVQGTNVTYTVVITNNMTVTQDDNFGHEWTDILPSGLTLLGGSATSGTVGQVANIFFWDGAIAPGESVTLTIEAMIDPTASGTISNQGQTIFNRDGDDQNESSHLTDDPSTAAVDDATSFNVIQSGEVLSTMSVSGTFVQGTDVTYTIVMTNNMTVEQPDNFGHEWTDILPSGLTPVSATATSGTIVICCSGQIVFWDGSIPAGGSVTLTFTATIDASASGTISNQGQTIFDRDGDNQNESSHLTDDPSTAAVDDATSFNVVQSGEVTATKTVSGTFVQSTDVTYTIVMTNNMTVTQPDNFGHEFTDTLPSGLTFVSATATSGTATHCCGNPGFVLWNGSIPAGGSVTITIVATIDATASGTISNQAHTIFDRNGDNQNESEWFSDATSFNVIQANEVTSTMSVSGTFVQGTTVTYTVVMTNNMTVTQPDNFGHEWTDILPSGLTLVGGSATSGTVGQVSNIIFWDGSIASGGSVTLTFTATISSTASGTISNQGQTIFDRNGDNQNESSHVTDDPSTAAVDDATSFNVVQANEVTSTMSVSGTFVQGTTVTYTVVMTNNMTVTQPDNFGHEWTDNLPSGLTLVGGSATSGTVGQVSNIIFWDGSIPSGGSVTLTFTATIHATASGTISNQGQTIFDRNGDGQNESSHLTDDPSTTAVDDATSFNVVQAGQVTATKTVSGTFVQGTTVTYTIVMTNNMTVTQPDNFGHEFTDTLPSGLTFVSATATSGTATHCCGNPGLVLWNGSIPAGGSVTITIVATIDATATGTISNQAHTIFDRNGDNQNESEWFSDATSFTVIATEADLSLTMSYLPASPGQNDDVTYTLVVTNNGPLTATNVIVTDDLPDDASFVSASSTQGSCTTADPVVCSVGTLASGASATMTIVIETPGSPYTSMTNTATAVSDLPDPTPASASATFNCMKTKKGVLKPCTSN